MRAWILIGLLLVGPVAAASSCDPVSHGLSEQERSDWETAIAAQLGAPKVRVLLAFASHGWRVVYVETPSSDSPFLFFNGTHPAIRISSPSGAAPPEWTRKPVFARGPSRARREYRGTSQDALRGM